MADYTVSAGHKGVGPWPLVASQVDTVTFTDNVGKVLVINPSTNTDDVWATNDGTTPSVPGAHVSTAAIRIPAGFALSFTLKGSTDVVKVISSGTPTISVQVDVE